MIATSQPKPTKTLTNQAIKQIRPLAEQRILLHNVSWETFERLLADVGDRRDSLFHYIDGNLEIMSPLSLHEGSNRFIEALLSMN
jgi:Uma2 family endonuclease